MTSNYYYGDNVNMHGGQGNTGIVRNYGTMRLPDSRTRRWSRPSPNSTG
ncbi:hypothetical protein ACQ4WX_28285 [Streptomyces lasalocidi]